MKKAQSMGLLWVGITILLFVILLFSTLSFGTSLLSGFFSNIDDERDALISATVLLLEDEVARDRKFMLELPMNSAIIIMNPGSGFKFKFDDPDSVNDELVKGVSFSRPPACEGQKTCVCSCRNIRFDVGEDTATRTDISCSSVSCESVDFKVPDSISNDILTRPTHEGSWKNSFILIRHDSIGEIYRDVELNPRRDHVIESSSGRYVVAGYENVETYQEQNRRFFDFTVKKVEDETVRFLFDE